MYHIHNWYYMSNFCLKHFSSVFVSFANVTYNIVPADASTNGMLSLQVFEYFLFIKFYDLITGSMIYINLK